MGNGRDNNRWRRRSVLGNFRSRCKPTHTATATPWHAMGTRLVDERRGTLNDEGDVTASLAASQSLSFFIHCTFPIKMNNDFPTPLSISIHTNASRYDAHQHIHRHQHSPGHASVDQYPHQCIPLRCPSAYSPPSTLSWLHLSPIVPSSHRRVARRLRLVVSSHVSHNKKNNFHHTTLSSRIRYYYLVDE